MIASLHAESLHPDYVVRNSIHNPNLGCRARSLSHAAGKNVIFGTQTRPEFGRKSKMEPLPWLWAK